MTSAAVVFCYRQREDSKVAEELCEEMLHISPVMVINILHYIPFILQMVTA